MTAEIRYLKNALGIEPQEREWQEAVALPLYLKSNLDISMVDDSGTAFLLARLKDEISLPGMKQAYAQLLQRTELPVVLSVPYANARQRRALVSQSIPFVCAGRQAYLPFLGMASTEWGKAKLELPKKEKLSPKAQQAAIWGAIVNKPYSLSELRLVTGMSASQASEATEELERFRLASRTKSGRSISVSPISADDLLDNSMALFSSPVVKTIAVRRVASTDSLPDAGETALAQRTSLNAPLVRQKAVARSAAKDLERHQVLEGELPDEETLGIQIWKYPPVFKGKTSIDDISLSLSLADNGDERVESEINSLFGKEYPWHEAQ